MLTENDYQKEVQVLVKYGYIVPASGGYLLTKSGAVKLLHGDIKLKFCNYCRMLIEGNKYISKASTRGRRRYYHVNCANLVHVDDGNSKFLSNTWDKMPLV